MNFKNVMFLVAAIALSLFAAAYRWGDSAHSMGLITVRGGKARHPAVFDGGKDRYTMITTATVIPPYKGDVRVSLNGKPELEYRLSASAPLINLNVRRLPEFRDNIFYGLFPKDRIALWLTIKAPALDPVCGMVYQQNFAARTHEGKEYYFCSKTCENIFLKEPGKFEDADGINGKYLLSFSDLKTGNPVLNIPVIFKGKGDKNHARGGHH